MSSEIEEYEKAVIEEMKNEVKWRKEEIYNPNILDLTHFKSKMPVRTKSIDELKVIFQSNTKEGTH